MNGVQLASVLAVGLRMNLRRLTTWVFAGVFVLIAVMLYRGGISFGGMTATGVKLATNSEYAIAAVLAAFSFMLMHFTATLTGDPVVKDVRLNTAPLLHATPLDSRTYLLGKFLGGYASLLSIYAVFLAALLVGQLLPPADDRLTLPFRVTSYLKFAFLFILVPTFFVGALSFSIGTLTGSMKLVYIAVTALLVAWFFVMQRLGDSHLRWLAYLEPSGLAWLAEHVAKSRGNAWLNTHMILPDLGFALNRLALLLIGAGALAFTLRRYRAQEHAGEFGGEVRPGRMQRFFAWTRGRPAEVADRYTNWSGQGAVPSSTPAAAGPTRWLAQLCASTATEVRLLAAERSLWIMVPMIMFLCGVDSNSWGGAFQLRVYPVSSEFAQHMVPVLLILLSGTTIFYTGEVFHRDDSNGVRGIIYATPVGNATLLLGKLFAMIALSSAMVLLTVATALVSQAVQWYGIDGRFYLDLYPYGQVLLRIVLPSVVILCTLALVVNVLVRGRYFAYFTLILLGGGYVWLALRGHRELLYNPLAIGHWGYSDITGLEPYAGALTLRDLYWGSLLALGLGLAAWFFERTQGRLRRYFAAAFARRRPGTLAWTVLALVAATFAGLRLHAEGNVRGTRAQVERAQLSFEDRWLPKFEEPNLAFASVDLDVRLRPAERALDVRGTIELANPTPQAIATARFTVDPLFEIRRFEIERQASPPVRDESLICVPLEPPLAPGERTRLFFDWSGVVHPGFPRDGGPPSSFIHRSAVFVTSFEPEIVPVLGISPSLFLIDDERRRAHGRGELHLYRDRSRDAFVPSVLGSDTPFTLAARIDAPAGLDVLCGGELLERRHDGERELFTYESEEPLYAFAILAADYAVERRGDDEVHFHAAHTFNLPTVLEALEDARARFGERFGPYPHRLLRIAEFPRVASFAQSYPTLMPYSEAIGFLTDFSDDSRFVDATYFVTAHEVAHQWWGYITNPGASLGAAVLSESLAEYSAMALIDEQRGERQRLVFLKREEDEYLRRRDPDKEVALAKLEFRGAEVWYHKGALVFYMLERQIGRDRLQAALKNYVARWRYLNERLVPGATPKSQSHPTLRDLLDEIRLQHPGQDLEWFYEQWFERVVVPDMAFDSDPLVREESGTWSVEFTATNLGQGRMPVHIALVRGEWRVDAERPLEERDFELSPPMRVWLEPGKSARGVLTCTFAPEAIVIDRDYECLDFDRTNNVRELNAGAARPSATVSSSPATRN